MSRPFVLTPLGFAGSSPLRTVVRHGLLGCLLSVSLSGCSSLHAPGYSKHDRYEASISRGKHTRPYRVRGKTYYPMASSKGYKEVGVASWYGHESGRRTATGEHFDPDRLSAAHKTLPLPTRVRVTNLENGRSTTLTVNDRGPFVNGRLIDLSYAAARRIAMQRRGSAKVLVEALD